MTAENERAYAFDNALGAQRERLRTLERILDPGRIGTSARRAARLALP